MINVLYISNQESLTGGAPRSLYEIISHLDRSMVKPFYASIHDDLLTKKIKDLEVKFHKMKDGYFLHPLISTSSFYGLIKFIKKNSIDLIHNNQCGDAYYSWLPAKFTRTPMIIHHRDSSFYRSSKFLLDLADANIAISSWQNEHNLANKGIVIHNAVDLDKFSKKSPDDDLFGLGKDKIIVGLIGRIAHDKGQDIFVKAAARVVNKHENVRFLIVGDDKDKNHAQYIHSLKHLVNELNLQSNVVFTGYIPNGYEIIHCFDISVIPSRREPFGRTIIESMACGKPVVATNVWGALDIVTPETGILIPPDDPNALADSIFKLVQSPNMRQSMGNSGRRRIEKNFSIENMMEKIYNVYYSVLGITLNL